MADDSPLLKAEQAAEEARTLAYRREAQRHGGVAWSGLAPEPFPMRNTLALTRDAETRAAALQRWRASRPGAILSAMLAAERAVETVRACIARGLAASDARCALALAELERATADARKAMDLIPEGGLSAPGVQ